MNIKKKSVSIYFVIVILLFLPSCKKVKVEGESAFKVMITILESGEAKFQEQIDLKVERQGSITRQLPFIGKTGTFLLPQRIADVEVRQGGEKGKILKSRLRKGDYWYNIDFLELPDNEKSLYLSYTLYDPLIFNGDMAELQWYVPGSFWPLDVLSVEISVKLPQEIDKEKVIIENTLGYFEPLKGEYQVTGTTIRWKSHEGFKPTDTPLKISLIFPKGKISKTGGSSLALELKSQAPWVTIQFLFFIMLGILFKFLSPQKVISEVRYLNFIFVPVLFLALIPQSMYWIFESGFRSGDITDGSVNLFFNIFALFFIFLFAFRQYKGLGAWEMKSYYNQFALLPVLSVVIVIPVPGIIIFTLSGLTVFLFWFRKDISFQFGAGIEQVVKEVNIRGEVSFEEISKIVLLKKEQLSTILKRLTALPLVADFESEKLYSSETMLLKKSIKVCPNCSGGSPVISGQAKVKCEYCGMQFTSKLKKLKPAKPVPVLVEAISTYFKTIGISFFFAAIMVTIIFAFLEFNSGSGFGAALTFSMINGLIIGALGYFFFLLAKNVYIGKWFGITKFLLIVSTPLIIPIIVLFKLRNILVKIHFNRYDPKLLGNEIRSRGEVSLENLAKLLNTSYSEASQAAAYLAGNNIIDVVYDRGEGRIISRDLYRKTSHKSSCGICGGLLGIIDGKTKCHFCGSEAL